MKNGRIFLATLVECPASDANAIVLSRNKTYVGRQLRNRGWVYRDNRWYAPDGAKREIQTVFNAGDKPLPQGEFIHVCFVRCLRSSTTHGTDRVEMVLSEGDMRDKLRLAGWQKAGDGWQCPYHR